MNQEPEPAPEPATVPSNEASGDTNVLSDDSKPESEIIRETTVDPLQLKQLLAFGKQFLQTTERMQTADLAVKQRSIETEKEVAVAQVTTHAKFIEADVTKRKHRLIAGVIVAALAIVAVVAVALIGAAYDRFQEAVAVIKELTLIVVGIAGAFLAGRATRKRDDDNE